MTDPMCVTPASLPNDSVSRRIRQLMKIQKPCSDVEPAIDAYSAQNECPWVSSWLIKTSCLFCFNLHSNFFPFLVTAGCLGSGRSRRLGETQARAQEEDQEDRGGEGRRRRRRGRRRRIGGSHER